MKNVNAVPIKVPSSSEMKNARTRFVDLPPDLHVSASQYLRFPLILYFRKPKALQIFDFF